MNVWWRGRVDFTLFETDNASGDHRYSSAALFYHRWHAVANDTSKAPDNDDNPDVPLHGHPSMCTIFRNLVRASRVSPVVHAR